MLAPVMEAKACEPTTVSPGRGGKLSLMRAPFVSVPVTVTLPPSHPRSKETVIRCGVGGLVNGPGKASVVLREE